MPYRSFDQNCSIARTLEVVGERWTILVLREVLLGFHRFEEIQRHLGIATNVLIDQNCSIARTLEVVGERWTILVLREVLLGFHRFEEIQRHLGIATNVLTDRLATLVD